MNRIKFHYFNYETSEYIGNVIYPEAKEILDYYKYKSHPYLLSIFKSKNYSTFFRNYNRQFRE